MAATVFRVVEGRPLHKYLVQLRLARALVEVPHADDLTALACELGFSNHSHFTAVFRRTFGCTAIGLPGGDAARAGTRHGVGRGERLRRELGDRSGNRFRACFVSFARQPSAAAPCQHANEPTRRIVKE